jgi:hypothetical protein
MHEAAVPKRDLAVPIQQIKMTGLCGYQFPGTSSPPLANQGYSLLVVILPDRIMIVPALARIRVRGYCYCYAKT